MNSNKIAVKTLYVACALTLAPQSYIDEVVALRDTLEKSYGIQVQKF